MRFLQIALVALPLAASLQHPLGSAGTLSPYKERPELPGGTPLRLCKESSENDLFQITAVELTKQPVYIEDDLLINIYGVFSDTWQDKPYHNATVNSTLDCGSHCDMYEVPPEDRGGDSWDFPFCNGTAIEQPRGRYRGETCPPVPGPALVTGLLYAWRLITPGPGWYNFTFDAKTAEGDRIFCMTAEVCLRWEDEKMNEGYPQGPWSNCTWPY